MTITLILNKKKYINETSRKLLTTDKEINNRWHKYIQKLLNEEFPH